MRTVRLTCTKPRRLGVVIARRTSVRSSREPINPIWLERLYLDAKYTASEYQGPVRVIDLPGKGRSVMAASDLNPGQLILVSKPLAYVTCPMGSIPSPEDLVAKIEESNYGPDELRILKSLFSGADFEDEEVDAEPELNDLKLFDIIACNAFGEEFTDFPTSLARNGPFTSSSSSYTAMNITTTGTTNGGAAAAAASGGASTGHQEGITEYTATAATAGSDASGGEPQVGHLGVFPSFSMLNHSCLPNAVNFVVGGNMLVIAGRHIPQGSEVLINYLGRASLRPVDERQAQLAEGYQFSCDCPRCRAELLYGCTNSSTAGGAHGAGSSLSEILHETLGRCKEREAALDQLGRMVAAAGDGADGDGAYCAAVLEGLLDSVRQDVTKWEEFTQRMNPLTAGVSAGPEAQRQWLRASAFDLYSQHASLAEAKGRRREALTAVRHQVELCEAVAPASDLHMYLGVKLALMAEQQEAAAAAAVAEVAEAQAMTAAVKAMGEEAGQELVTAAAAAAKGAGLGGTEWQRCMGLLQLRYGAGLSGDTLTTLLRGAVYGISQVAM